MWRDRRCGGDIKITDSGTTQPDTSAGSHHKTWGKRQLLGEKKSKIVLAEISLMVSQGSDGSGTSHRAQPRHSCALRLP